MACTIDFRRLDEGFGGKTAKRKRQESQIAIETASDVAAAATATATSMDVDDSYPPPAKRSAIASSDDPNKPTFGQPTYDGVIAGRVSGRNWKQPRKQRSSAKNVSIRRTSVEERDRQKEIKKAYKERVNELKEEIRQNKIEKRKKREEREKKKKENILKSGTKFQTISNPKTLKKIAKSKHKKLLQVVPDEFINKKPKSSS